jgi:hypothetical protein
MPRDVTSITICLIMLLQKRELPWPTLALIESTITADARASRYSPYAKGKWSTDQWLSFLDEGEMVCDACAACVAAFRDNSDVAAFNSALDKIRQRLVAIDAAISGEEMMSGPRDRRPPVELPPPPEAGSIAWLRLMFLGWGRPHTTTQQIMAAIADADERAFSLVKDQQAAGSGDRAHEYDGVYQACEAGIAVFLENADLAALNSHLETILQQLTAIAPPKA